MIRLFNVYYPTRTIVLLLCEALIVSGCFLLATVLLLTAISQRFRTHSVRIGLAVLAALLVCIPLWRIIMLPRI